MTISKTIEKTALSYVGQEEIRGNAGFLDELFEDKIQNQGWTKGQAWCSYFAELIMRESGLFDMANKMSGSAVETWRILYPLFTCDKTPKKGCLVLWQNYTNGKQQWTGHAGIVVGVDNGQIITVEGNTNDDGEREGYEVALRIRKLDYTQTNGLRMLGFVHPKD